jgi:hypothetical protein
MKTSLTIVLTLILTASVFSQMRLVLPGTTTAKIDTGSMHWQSLQSITVNTSYFMDISQISYDQYNLVRDWANAHGYDLDSAKNTFDYASPKNWFNAVKFCNARSEYEGLKPAYYTSISIDTSVVGNLEYLTIVRDTIYRTGNHDITSDYIDTIANGYKLPTSNQWLLAAYTAKLNMFSVDYSFLTWAAGSNICWDRYTFYHKGKMAYSGDHARWLWVSGDSTAIYTIANTPQSWNSFRCVRNFVLPDTTSQVSVTEPVALIKGFELLQNYPNPFNPSTSISYNLPKTNMVNITIYDLQGRQVSMLVNTVQSAGAHEITWNASHLSSGTYLCRISYQNVTLTRKLLLLK